MSLTETWAQIQPDLLADMALDNALRGVTNLLSLVEAVAKRANDLASRAIAQVERLASLDVPRKALRLAKSDHARWMKRLAFGRAPSAYRHQRLF